jgi:hypothetical protein
MKKISLCLILVLLSALLMVCSGDEDVEAFEVVKSYKLPDPAYGKWDEIEHYWFKNIYRKVLAKHKLKLSCADCANIYYIVILYIDRDGRLAKHKKLKEKVCFEKGPKGLLQDFLKYFKDLEFPKELRSMAIEVRLGTGLKC